MIEKLEGQELLPAEERREEATRAEERGGVLPAAPEAAERDVLAPIPGDRGSRLDDAGRGLEPLSRLELEEPGEAPAGLEVAPDAPGPEVAETPVAGDLVPAAQEAAGADVAAPAVADDVAEPLLRIDPADLRGAAEALLFSLSEPVTIRSLAELLGVSVHETREVIEDLRLEYISGQRAFRIEDIAGGVQLLTLPRFDPWIRKLRQKEKESRLTPAAMESLAVIAYKQPISKADLEGIRGVGCGPTLKTLLERGLIQIAGRGEGLGKPLLYGTTKRFLESFGISSVRELPQPELTERPQLPAGAAAGSPPRELRAPEPLQGVELPEGSVPDVVRISEGEEEAAAAQLEAELEPDAAPAALADPPQEEVEALLAAEVPEVASELVEDVISSEAPERSEAALLPSALPTGEDAPGGIESSPSQEDGGVEGSRAEAQNPARQGSRRRRKARPESGDAPSLTDSSGPLS